MVRIHARVFATALALGIAGAGFATYAPAADMEMSKTVMVGGAPMYPTKDIVDNAMNSKDHTTLVTAVKAAGLVETLKGPGPFTVFAPDNMAFGKLPAGTVDNLLKPENKAMLAKILTYHVVPGRITAAELADRIRKEGGTAKLKTVQGEWLWATQSGDTIWIKDAKGGTSKITISNVYQSNGVIHVLDTVLMPS
jgi:uncharacterized surface protein with fasciclin (FAS1) repeats